MINNTNLIAGFSNPVRRVSGKVAIGEQVFDATNRLIEYTVNRVGEGSRFFGFGICHKINVKLIDKDRELSFPTGQVIQAQLGIEDAYAATFPNFYITEVHRDENTNALSITAYDKLYEAKSIPVEELELATPYTTLDFVVAIATRLGLAGYQLIGLDTSAFGLAFEEEGANLNGTETLNEILDALADATQSIYYIDKDNCLVFKRLDKDGNHLFTIDKNNYLTLDSGDNRRLGTIYHTTELGDSVYYSIEQSGTTQYIRNNPFWELREDITVLVENAVAAIGGLTINQFKCEWRGNPLVEIGDKIALTTKDNNTVYSFLLDDVIKYDGTLKETTAWEFDDDVNETAANPTSLGDALKKTYAKVDKINKNVEIVVSDADATKAELTAIKMNLESIDASVKSVETNVNATIEGVNTDMAILTKKVDAAITDENVRLVVQEEISAGVKSITTSTGYTFDADGLKINKSGSEMTTQVSEDGMTVFRDKEAVLTANNTGVYATNLHATTYLIVGQHTRFEDYEKDGEARTGAFWIN